MTNSIFPMGEDTTFPTLQEFQMIHNAVSRIKEEVVLRVISSIPPNTQFSLNGSSLDRRSFRIAQKAADIFEAEFKQYFPQPHLSPLISQIASAQKEHFLAFKGDIRLRIESALRKI